MRVLGISPLDKDATASFVDGGRLLFAAGEERFSRIKQHAGFPQRAIEAGLAYTGWEPRDIDAVAYAFLSAEREGELIAKAIAAEKQFTAEFHAPPLGPLLAAASARVPQRSQPIHGLREPNQRMDKSAARRLFYRFAGGGGSFSDSVARRMSRRWAAQALADHRRWQRELEAGLKGLGLLEKLQRSEHHTSHAANAYLASGFERALVVTIDGYGSGLAGSVSLGEGSQLKRLDELPFPHSLGTFYEMVTSSLGFQPDRHAGKIVGLAAYGDPAVLADVLLSRVQRTPGTFRMLQNLNVFFSRNLSVHFPMVDLAAGWQRVLEVLACHVVEHWLTASHCDSVVLSGGVAANVKMNQRIHELPGLRRVFIYPNMGDGGCGTGLALLLSWPRGSMASGVGAPLRDVYLGPEYGEEDMRAALERGGLVHERPAQLAAEVARRIHAGQVVARFDGRMEYGPRALGNRSILYHAREPGVNQWLNQRLGRTEFMPFAPVTLFEAAGRCYEHLAGAEHAAEFMTITFDCTPWMREHCPAAVHVDGTARPQLLRRETNPGYYDILKEYERLSGIPCLINTSFNMHEEPIVCSPEDAIRSFLLGHLDAMVMGPFLVVNPAAV